MNRHKLLSVMASMMLVVLFLAGCGAPTTTPTPTSTATPTAAPVTTGQVKGRLNAEGVKVTLCIESLSGGFAGIPYECKDESEQSVTTDATGHFHFSAVPAGTYYILFDIPEALKDFVPPPCMPGDYLAFGDSVRGGVQVSCLSREYGPTVVVEAGQITKYVPVKFVEILFPTSLPQPTIVGPVNAGGNAEVTIVNDSPQELSVHFDGPHSQSLKVGACQTCKEYSGVGPSSCQVVSRPQATVRIPPGAYKVSARVGDFSVTGQWTLQGDKSYQSCYFIVLEETDE